MKKLIIFSAAVLLVSTVLCGCKKDESPSPTDSATQSPTAGETTATETPTEAATSAAVNSGEPVDASWFDDAVFIGDSITVALNYACADDPSMLGNAAFVCSQSLGYHNALWSLDTEGAVHPTYRGSTVLAETAAEVTGAKKVFILLGVNDIGTYGAEDTMEQAKELASRILSHSPGVALYFQSTTPMIEDKESGWLNNDKITDFDNLLKAYCDEKGYGYIDLYHQVCDENGKLNENYCGDPEVQGIHFNTEGCNIWANYLKSAVGGIKTSSTAQTAAVAGAAVAASSSNTADSRAEAPAASSADTNDTSSSSQSDPDEDIIYYKPDDDDDDEYSEDEYAEDDEDYGYDEDGYTDDYE